MEVDFGQSWVDIAGTLCKVKYLAALPLLERKHRAWPRRRR